VPGAFHGKLADICVSRLDALWVPEGLRGREGMYVGARAARQELCVPAAYLQQQHCDRRDILM